MLRLGAVYAVDRSGFYATRRTGVIVCCAYVSLMNVRLNRRMGKRKGGEDKLPDFHMLLKMGTQQYVSIFMAAHVWQRCLHRVPHHHRLRVDQSASVWFCCNAQILWRSASKFLSLHFLQRRIHTQSFRLSNFYSQSQSSSSLVTRYTAWAAAFSSVLACGRYSHAQYIAWRYWVHALPKQPSVIPCRPSAGSRNSFYRFPLAKCAHCWTAPDCTRVSTRQKMGNVLALLAEYTHIPFPLANSIMNKYKTIINCSLSFCYSGGCSWFPRMCSIYRANMTLSWGKSSRLHRQSLTRLLTLQFYGNGLSTNCSLLYDTSAWSRLFTTVCAKCYRNCELVKEFSWNVTHVTKLSAMS